MNKEKITIFINGVKFIPRCTETEHFGEMPFDRCECGKALHSLGEFEFDITKDIRSRTEAKLADGHPIQTNHRP